MEHSLKEAIRHEYVNIVTNIGVGVLHELVGKLFATKLIDEEEKSLINEKRTPYAKTEVLLDLILKNSPVHASLFLKSLKEIPQCNGLVEMLQKTCHDIVHGRILTDNVMIEDVKQKLRTVYKEAKYNCIEAIPGEKFQLDLEKKTYVMPMELTSEVKVETQQAELLPERELEPKYEKCPFGNIEEVLGKLLENDNSQVVWCTGNAGTGKTVAVHRMICQYIEQSNEDLNKYDLIINIPMRKIDPNATLLEILSPNRKGLGYFNDKMCKAVVDYLGSNICSKRILIILDGVDEVDLPESSELYNLMTKQLFSSVKLLIMCRPEAKILQHLRDGNFSPNYQINIHGTSTIGVYKYLEEMVGSTNEEAKQEVHNIITKCEENAVAFSLLKLPIYLTLVGIMLNDHWVIHANFAQFKMPTTITQFFNGFYNIFIRLWLEKIPYIRKPYPIEFQRYCLGNDSTVPVELQSKIERLARMSYDFLKKSQYDFSKKDLKKYLICEDDILLSGFFCHSNGKMFFRHKLMQEYMSALYIVHSLCKDNIERVSGYQILEDIFSGMESVIQFAFGMSPDFAVGLLKKIQNHHKVVAFSMGNEKQHLLKVFGVKLAFISRLCIESKDPQVTESLVQLLLMSKIEYSNLQPDSNLSLQADFFKSMTEKQASLLLRKWYNIQVFPHGKLKTGNQKEAYIRHVSLAHNSKHLRIKYLDRTLMLLLQKFQLPEIQTVHIEHSPEHVPDLQTLLQIFPQLEKFYGSTSKLPRPDDVEILNSSGQQPSSATLTHFAHDHLIYKQESQEYLLHQSKLQTLYASTEMFSNLKVSKCLQNLNWSELQTLCLKGKSDISSVCLLMQYIPNLTFLSLFGMLCYLPAQLYRDLLQNIKIHLVKLRKVCVDDINYNQTKELFDTIRQCKQIDSIGFSYYDLNEQIDCIVNELQGTKNIKTLHILYHKQIGGDEDVQQNDPQKAEELKRVLLQSNVSTLVQCVEKYPFLCYDSNMSTQEQCEEKYPIMCYDSHMD